VHELPECTGLDTHPQESVIDRWFRFITNVLMRIYPTDVWQHRKRATSVIKGSLGHREVTQRCVHPFPRSYSLA
jgi:hypothetical protein